MNKSYSRAILAVVLIASIAIAGVYYFKLANQKEKKSELPTIKVAYNAQNLDAAPMIIAYDKRYFEDNGVKVELVQASGSEAAVAIGAGQVDLAVVSAPRIYSPIEKGVPVRILSPMSNTDSQLFVRPNSGITKIKDLEGKKVTYGPGGGTKELFIKSILNKENVDISKINFVDVDNSYLHVALMDKKTVDVILVADAHYVDEAEKLGAVVLPEWKEKDYAKTTTGLTVSANTNYLKDHEKDVENFFKAIIEGNRYIKNSLDDASKVATNFMRTSTNGALDVKAEDFAKLVTEGRVSYVLWEDTRDVLGMGKVSQEIGTLQKAPSESDLYDLRFKTMLVTAQNEIYGSK